MFQQVQQHSYKAGQPQSGRALVFVRALLVCGGCLAVSRTWQAEAASFPLVITAMTAHARHWRDAERAGIQLAAHLLSAAGAALVPFLAIAMWVSAGAGPIVLPMGCVLLLGLQFTRFRHPPAMASGGAVLCGLDPFAVAACVVVTGAVLIAELSVLRLRSTQS
ncbi:hypothetical protein [Cupriavidus necator]